jgi:hypothetical protein
MHGTFGSYLDARLHGRTVMVCSVQGENGCWHQPVSLPPRRNVDGLPQGPSSGEGWLLEGWWSGFWNGYEGVDI